jgi:HAD superfamily hydrolase (TIGR01509 family)
MGAMTNQLGVIFDVDGVLVDSYRAHLKSWQRAAATYGLTMSEDDFARTFGRKSVDIINHLWPGRFDLAGAMTFDAGKEAAFREIMRVEFPEMPGASELIAALHAAGFAMAIGSSGPPENVELVRKTLRNGSMITAAVNGFEVKVGKPDPEVFLTAGAKLGLPPRSCAVVEDAVAGVQAARRAGMVAIGLTGTNPRDKLAVDSTIVVDKLSELSPKGIAELLAAPTR